MLKRLWELDSEPVVNKKLLTPEEQSCEDHFAATICRDNKGRYIVKLPFRCANPPCKEGNSKSIAVKRLLGLERKLSRDLELKNQYSDVIKEYLFLGHLEQITDESDKNRNDVVYLPHHAVVRYDKVTTKVRVVFDASCKGTICLVADIEKMYRQVKVSKDDIDYQRIVWREDPTTDIQHFRLLTVTFGTSCAPYLAVKTLQQVAADEGESYPLAAERVKSDFYMDDLMSGCQSETEAVEIYEQMNGLLAKGGFKLQKWSSNKVSLLEELQEGSCKDLEIVKDKVQKVLGLTWNCSTDMFDYSVRMSPPTAPETKRTVMSEISRLYDPLGWIAPCIITSKAFIQKLWISGIEWDEELPPNLLEEWKGYREELGKLISFHIPRWIGRSESNITIELHGFGDASSIAYAAAVYCRIIDSDGCIHSNLLTAKTKVAPIHQISIPRLELYSSVVLAWLNDHPSRWKTYVANRTSEILGLVDNSQWAHVVSKDNPADIASRGVSPSILLESDLWKYGPSWLKNDHIIYARPRSISTNEEKKQIKAHIAKIVSDFDEDFGTRFSTLRKLVRVIAYCRRFISPNFGGLWEAGIKSVKHHLKRVVGDSTLTFEELSTVLSQIEACLNSRPLSQGSDDPEDPAPLTPGHFLVGCPLVVAPDHNYECTTVSTLRRWQLVQRMVQSFWRRWRQEYLTNFFQRQKWATQIPNLKIGNIVLVKEDNLPPSKWLYGRIVELHPGQDGMTRVVTLRCKGSTFKRPVSKLCLFPVME
ncbi:uncharacterized protein LOC142985830 [Anticarsia gemmatalis]|uniref:uncharacterized protein LOC142985830 n=1 Tax=Anticarsia gemmatalis TaxID=129554 RepID=UPI003F776F19